MSASYPSLDDFSISTPKTQEPKDKGEVGAELERSQIPQPCSSQTTLQGAGPERELALPREGEEAHVQKLKSIQFHSTHLFVQQVPGLYRMLALLPSSVLLGSDL